jgi:steroid 5-alpha reductase family enzyme
MMISSYIDLLITGWPAVALVMFILWGIQRAQNDASALDAGWAAGLGILAVYYSVVAPGDPSRRIWMGFLAGFWAFRLSAYLLMHRVVGRSEDNRYRTLRERWGDRAQRNFFFLYQAEALLCVVLSIPFLLVSFNPSPSLHVLEILGVVVWFLAIVGETAADRQLTAFRADDRNRGKTCRLGLWRYSRHPNYFFEWLNWCAYALMSLPAPYGWAGIVSPAIMLLLILKVTGIPPTEEQAVASRGEDYRDYQRTTSSFVPWFPKRSTS